VIRLTAFLIVMSLSELSMAAVVCAWSCHAGHAPVSTPASGGCHEHEAPAEVPSVSGGHACDDLVELPETGISPARPSDGQPAVVQTTDTVIAAPDVARAAADAPFVSRPPGPARLVLPLRI